MERGRKKREMHPVRTTRVKRGEDRGVGELGLVKGRGGGREEGDGEERGRRLRDIHRDRTTREEGGIWGR